MKTPLQAVREYHNPKEHAIHLREHEPRRQISLEYCNQVLETASSRMASFSLSTGITATTTLSQVSS